MRLARLYILNFDLLLLDQIMILLQWFLILLFSDLIIIYLLYLKYLRYICIYLISAFGIWFPDRLGLYFLNLKIAFLLWLHFTDILVVVMHPILMVLLLQHSRLSFDWHYTIPGDALLIVTIIIFCRTVLIIRHFGFH